MRDFTPNEVPDAVLDAEQVIATWMQTKAIDGNMWTLNNLCSRQYAVRLEAIVNVLAEITHKNLDVQPDNDLP